MQAWRSTMAALYRRLWRKMFFKIQENFFQIRVFGDGLPQLVKACLLACMIRNVADATDIRLKMSFQNILYNKNYMSCAFTRPNYYTHWIANCVIFSEICWHINRVRTTPYQVMRDIMPQERIEWQLCVEL
jgi:hypothetical protein